MPIKLITPEDLFRLHQSSGPIEIIDVREREEFAEVNSPLAVNFPLSTLNPDAIAQGRDPNAPLYVVCRSGRRSMKAAEVLASKGFHTVYNVEGGMLEWEASGLPVVRR